MKPFTIDEMKSQVMGWYKEYKEKKEICSYCNIAMSHGNDKVYKDKDVELYIVGGLLYLLKDNCNNANKIEINYCPICGKKLEHV